MNTIFFDIDDTLADARWRADLRDESWDHYHEASLDDKPIDATCELVRIICNSPAATEVVILTARPEKHRGITTRWLARHGLLFTYLLMRRDEDHRPAAEVKRDLAIDFFDGEENMRKYLLAIVDDHDPTLEAFAAMGILTMKVTNNAHAR